MDWAEDRLDMVWTRQRIDWTWCGLGRPGGCGGSVGVVVAKSGVVVAQWLSARLQILWSLVQIPGNPYSTKQFPGYCKVAG